MNARRAGGATVIVALALWAGGCACRRPPLDPTVHANRQPKALGTGSLKASPTVRWMDYRHDRGRSELAMRLEADAGEAAVLVHGSNVMTAVSGAELFVGDGMLYVAPRPGKYTPRVYWWVLATQHVGIGIQGRTVLVENPPATPGAAHVERIYLIDAPTAGGAVQVKSLTNPAITQTMFSNAYIEVTVDPGGAVTIGAPTPMPASPADPLNVFVGEMTEAATAMGLRPW